MMMTMMMLLHVLKSATALSDVITGAFANSFPIHLETVALGIAILICVNVIVVTVANDHKARSGGGLEGVEKRGDDVDFHCVNTLL